MQKTKTNDKELTIKEDWDQQLARQYEVEAARCPALGDAWISTKGSQFRFLDFTGSEMRVVVLGWSHERTWFKTKFIAGVSASPSCWALELREADLAPDDDVPEPQAPACAECPLDEFGSGDGNNNKACRDGFRLACLVLYPDGTDGALGFVRLAPTSGKAFRTLVNRVLMTKRPLRSVSVRLAFDPSVTYPKVTFSKIEPVENPQLIEALLSYPTGAGSELTRKLLRGYRTEVEAAARASAEDQARIDEILGD